MSMRTHYVGDDVLHKGTPKDVDGNELNPTSATVSIYQDDGTEIVAPGTSATVSSNQVQYLQTSVTEGLFTLYFKVLIGTDDRTFPMHFRVITVDGQAE